MCGLQGVPTLFLFQFILLPKTLSEARLRGWQAFTGQLLLDVDMDVDVPNRWEPSESFLGGDRQMWLVPGGGVWHGVSHLEGAFNLNSHRTEK